jgi:hypothetical protein
MARHKESCTRFAKQETFGCSAYIIIFNDLLTIAQVDNVLLPEIACVDISDAHSQKYTKKIQIQMTAQPAGGAPDRTRTCNPEFRRLVLYPVELRAPEGIVKQTAGLSKGLLQISFSVCQFDSGQFLDSVDIGDRSNLDTDG